MESIDDSQANLTGCDVPRKFTRLEPTIGSRDDYIILCMKHMSKYRSCISLYEGMGKESPLYPKKNKIYDKNQIKGDADFHLEELIKSHDAACDLCDKEDCVARHNHVALLTYLGSGPVREAFLKDLRIKPNLGCTTCESGSKQIEMF